MPCFWKATLVTVSPSGCSALTIIRFEKPSAFLALVSAFSAKTPRTAKPLRINSGELMKHVLILLLVLLCPIVAHRADSGA